MMAFVAAMGGEALAAGPAPENAPIVVAQNEGWHPLRPLFRLFGGGRTQKRTVKEVEQKKPVVRRAPVAPKIVEVPKDPDARVILVVGDTMADGVHTGLTSALAETPGLKVEKLVQRSQGLVREPEWPARIIEALETQQVDLVVVMLGADDRRPIQGKAGRLTFRDPEWERAYRDYVQGVVSAVREARKPLIWVGLPPASGPDRRADFLYLNDIYKAQVEPADAIFVDIWEAFLSEAGKYTSYGADVDGTRRRLRTEDGLYFNWWGYRKVAFFVEQPIARILGEGPALDLALPQNDPDFLLLTGIASEEETLAGAEIAPAIPIEGSLQHKLIVEGRALPRVAGRADDFTRPAE
ncbi:GDSL-type esterase/lipase family protein [Breoghania sp. L-A4]|uniref:SGNH/GDSL hydrolase family protein n=1 Tax=Breoghania sp. L-A4 TaxID=2304600 RepID=UPI0013C32381|nr:GDSL-type esterase/lipase family protein [Breoghania sp. L-A4]